MPPDGLLEDADEQLADGLALLLRVDDAGEPLEEPVGGPDVDELDALMAVERLDDLVALALAHQPGVDEHARELRADRLVHERGGHGRVDAAGQAADDPSAADLGAHRVDLLLDDRAHRPRRRAAARVVEEVLEHRLAVRRCARPRDGTARRRCAGSTSSNAATGVSGSMR